VDSNIVYAVTPAGSLKPFQLYSAGLYPASKRPDLAVWNLALAILLQACRDVVAPPRRRRFSRKFAEWREDAVEWFFSENDNPGSYKWVRQILGIGSDGLRHWVRAYQDSSPTARIEMLKQLKHVQMRR